MINKIESDPLSAVMGIPDGAVVAIGGFGDCGLPNELIGALCDRDVRELHVISNNGGSVDTRGIGRLLAEGRVRKMTCSFPVHPLFIERYFEGKVELDLTPQGTIAERLRAGGAGIGGFYTPTGVGTLLGDGGFTAIQGADQTPATLTPAKERRNIDGTEFVLEFALVPDVALIHARTADRYGNLRFRFGAQNFNLCAGMAARRTIAEAEDVLPEQCIEPNDVQCPGIFVSSVVQVSAEPVYAAG